MFIDVKIERSKLALLCLLSRDVVSKNFLYRYFNEAHARLSRDNARRLLLFISSAISKKRKERKRITLKATIVVNNMK